MWFASTPKILRRAEPNPMDKCTIVSIYPQAITENKPTLTPRTYTIGAGSYDNPAVLTIGSASWWSDLVPEQEPIEVTVNSIVIAESFVQDFVNGMVGFNGIECMPGLFVVLGEHDVASIKKNHKDKLDRALRSQRAWFTELVRLADIDWSRTNGNPLVISAQAKMAAEFLQLDKTWMRDFSQLKKVNCIACGELRDPAYPICRHCHHVVDKAAFDKLGLAKAG